MLKDLVRVEVYRKALEAVITSDSTVLDMGAGSGILSFLAAMAGAKKVYAVEKTGITRLTRELAECNRLLDRVEVLNSDVLDIQLPAQVDVIVSEFLGPYGIDENFLQPLLIARDRWLKPGGKMLPERVTAWMAPAYDPAVDSELFFWSSRPYGIDLQPIAKHTCNEIRYAQQNLNVDNLIAAAQPMWITDLYALLASDARTSFHCSNRFVCTRPAKLNSVVVWFDAEFPGGIVLACGPAAPTNHWASTVCPLQTVYELSSGDQIRIDFECELDEIPGRSFTNWSVWINDKFKESHDTRNSFH
jgi:SAM-dependent methyltransferase